MTPLNMGKHSVRGRRAFQWVGCLVGEYIFLIWKKKITYQSWEGYNLPNQFL